MSSHAARTRTLPSKPSLSQLRKQAKELLGSFRAGNELAVAEIERFERKPDPASFALADAQRVLARAYGFPSWTSLKNHVEGVNFAALLTAAETGDVAAVRRLAAARPDLINPHVAEFRDSALHRAVVRRDLEMTRILMELGADARTGIWPHRDATSAYVIAVDRGYGEIVSTIEREEVARRARLSQSKAVAATPIDELWGAIAEGRSTDAISLLEADRTLIGVCDVDGVTALHLAAWKHDAPLVDWLLKAGALPGLLARVADPVQRDPAKTGSTPLDFAAIVVGPKPEGRDRVYYFMETAHVDRSRFQETARLLLKGGAELTSRAAVALGDRETVLRLHREDRLPNDIHMYRGGLLAIAVRVNQLEMITTLLDLGLDPDESVVTDDGARSWGMPLWFASMCGRLAIAELLLSRGADANAIVYACGDALGHCGAGDEKMEALLLKHGARLTVEQLPEGEQGREMARAILTGELPASSLNVDEPTQSDLAEQMLWATGDIEIVKLCLPHITRRSDDPWWNYVLIHTGQPEKLTLLLKHGVDPNVPGNEGYTALHHLASDSCRLDDCQTRVILATMLLDSGASMTIRDTLLKSTPLGWACRWGRIELVELYLERGASVVEADAESWATPLEWATKREHREIADLLRSRGATQ